MAITERHNVKKKNNILHDEHSHDSIFQDTKSIDCNINKGLVSRLPMMLMRNDEVSREGEKRRSSDECC